MNKNIFFLSLFLLQSSCCATNPTPFFDTNKISTIFEKFSPTELEQLMQQAQTMLDREEEKSAEILHKFDRYTAAALGIIIVGWLLWYLPGINSNQLIMKDCFEYGSLRFCDSFFDIGNHCSQIVECVTNLITDATICSEQAIVCLDPLNDIF